MNKQQLKHELRSNLVDIGRRAIEHALRFLPQDNPSRKIVEGRLASLRNGEATKLISSIKPETEYTQESCIRRASSELLKLSVSEKWLSGGSLTLVFTPSWDAGSFVGRGEEAQKEMKWQAENLHPMIGKAFEQIRNKEKNLKAA
jgi:hypothetical protein